MSAAPSFASTPMSSAAHHAAAEQDNYFPTVSSAQSSDIHADSQHYSSKPEQYDDDGILNDSDPPSRQVALRPDVSCHWDWDSEGHALAADWWRNHCGTHMISSVLSPAMLTTEFLGGAEHS